MSSVVGELLQPAAPIGSYTLSRDLAFEAIDAAAATLLGQEEASLLGRGLLDAFPRLRGSTLHRRFSRAIQGRGTQRFVYHHREAGRWYAVAAEPVGAAEHPQGIVVRFAEVTAELADIREGIEWERLDAAAQAVGRLAHDMNNCLTVALGNAEYLEEELADRPDLLAAVRLILDAAERGAALTGRVLRFARRDRRGGELDLLPFLGSLAGRLEAEAPAWPVEERLAADLPLAQVDPAELERALRELVANARAALPGGGRITITAEPVAGGEGVAIAVEDGGRGMSQSMLRRCVEPFVSGGGGLGLGLSAVHGLAAAEGGSLRLESRAGGGTRAILELPAAPLAAPGPPAATGLCEILLAEDDPAGRAGLSRLLRALGHQVIATASAAEALEALRAGAMPQLLLADIVLPGGLDGTRLVEEARRIRPGLPAILVSGYAARLPGVEPELQAGVPLLPKPFRKAELVRAIDGVLRRTGAAHAAAPREIVADQGGSAAS
jgi:signal transduction histidine kinase/ActR/RegA family two-component response regulator